MLQISGSWCLGGNSEISENSEIRCLRHSLLCSLRSKILLNSNDIAESKENGIPNLPTVDVVHIKPVELNKDVQACNLNSQQASQGIISNPLTLSRIRPSPSFSVNTLTPARMTNTEKDPLCSLLPIDLVTSQLTHIEKKVWGKIMTMKSSLMMNFTE